MSAETVVVEEPEEVTVTELTVVERNELAQLDVQIATAKKYPRSIDQFKKECEALATIDAETAESMFYRLPERGGKTIEGPTVRLAEIVASTWTNMHVMTRMLDVQPDDRYVRAQSICWDMQKNVRIGVEASRRRTTKKGEIYGDDMTGVAQQAAMSVAFRNNIFKVVPFTYVKAIFEKCKLVSVGKDLSMEQRQVNATKAFKAHGVQERQLLEMLEIKSWTDATIDDFITLRGVLTAIKEGQVTVKEAFAKEPPANGGAGLQAGKPEPKPAPRGKELDKLSKGYAETVVAAINQEEPPKVVMGANAHKPTDVPVVSPDDDAPRASRQ